MLSAVAAQVCWFPAPTWAHASGVTASAWKKTDSGTAPTTLARRVSAPTVVPRVQLVTRAIPSVPVVTTDGVTLPPPKRTAKLTVTPGTGAPPESLTITEGAMGTAVPWAARIAPSVIVRDSGGAPR